MALRILKAKPSDLRAIIALNDALADYHYKLDPFWTASTGTHTAYAEYAKANLSNPKMLWLVAKDGVRTIGYFVGVLEAVRAHIKPRIGKLSTGYVIPSCRGRGVARRAWARLQKWFKAHRVHVAEVGVDTRNLGSVEAWQKLGFTPYMLRLKQRI